MHRTFHLTKLRALCMTTSSGWKVEADFLIHLVRVGFIVEHRGINEPLQNATKHGCLDTFDYWFQGDICQQLRCMLLHNNDQCLSLHRVVNTRGNTLYLSL